MKTRLFASVLVMSAGLVIGCEKEKEADMTDVSSSDEVYVAPEAPTAPVAYTPVAEPVPTAGAGGSYTVQRGDTLWSIAQRTYGDGKRYHDIVAANPGLEPTKLRVGQSITLPN